MVIVIWRLIVLFSCYVVGFPLEIMSLCPSQHTQETLSFWFTFNRLFINTCKVHNFCTRRSFIKYVFKNFTIDFNCLTLSTSGNGSFMILTVGTILLPYIVGYMYITSVSYTHLDVYKRQLQDSTIYNYYCSYGISSTKRL